MDTEVALSVGRLSGRRSAEDSSIRVFRGIPYAQPPVGDLRWKAPLPARSWTGTRDATRFSVSCIQNQHSSGFVWRREAFSVSEDCLYLNLWAPDTGQDLPVMVWFHGGAHTSGQGHSLIFDGTRLAQEGVVIVTINYRLGALGFLAHPWLAAESEHNSAGNYGLLDKIAALKWVRSHIEAFGGNPDNVTIFGQSAGSQSVCSLMASPLADGLFHRAIGQSASCVGRGPGTDANGQARGERLVAELDVADLTALRSVPADALLQATADTGWASRSRIVVDGYVLPEAEVDVFRRGDQAPVPLLLGSLANEGRELIPRNDELTEAELDVYLQRTFGEQAELLKTLYESTGSPGAIQHAIGTDYFMAFGMRRWAEYHVDAGSDAYLYFMDHQPPAFHLYMPESRALTLAGGARSAGAYHSGDLAYVFGTVGLVGTDWLDTDRDLSDIIIRYWTNFARDGNPNGAGTPRWQRYGRPNHETLVLMESPHMVSGIRRAKIDAMAAAHPATIPMQEW